jgi:hypothetical protein
MGYSAIRAIRYFLPSTITGIPATIGGRLTLNPSGETPIGFPPEAVVSGRRVGAADRQRAVAHLDLRHFAIPL